MVGMVGSVRCEAPGEVYYDAMTFERITVHPGQMGGVPCIRGMRIPVATVLSMVADGMTTAEILADLPDLTGEDVAEALRFAADDVHEVPLPPQRSWRPHLPQTARSSDAACDRITTRVGTPREC
jgi:Uncharacterized conserved protein